MYTITPTTTIGDLVSYVEATPSAQTDLRAYIGIIEENDDAGYLTIHNIIDTMLNIQRPTTDIASTCLALAIISSGYPKMGTYAFHFWRYNTELAQLGITQYMYDSLKLDSNANWISSLTPSQLTLLPIRIQKREASRKRADKRIQDLKNIQLNAFSFKIFQNAINNTGKQLTIKDGLEYLSKLTSIHQTLDRDKTLTPEMLEIYYQWAGYIYSKIRNPNDDVKRVIKEMQYRANNAIYWHYLPTVYISQSLPEEVMKTLVNHTQVVLNSKVLTIIWTDLFKGGFAHITSMLNIYTGYNEVFLSQPDLYVHKLDDITRTNQYHKIKSFIQILRYLAFKNQVLNKSVWFNNIIHILLNKLKNIEERSNDRDTRYAITSRDDALAQEDFIKYYLSHLEVTTPDEPYKFDPIY